MDEKERKKYCRKLGIQRFRTYDLYPVSYDRSISYDKLLEKLSEFAKRYGVEKSEIRVHQSNYVIKLKVSDEEIDKEISERLKQEVKENERRKKEEEKWRKAKKERQMKETKERLKAELKIEKQLYEHLKKKFEKKKK